MSASGFRRVKVVNEKYNGQLRVSVVFRECDLISSHHMRYSQIINNRESGSNWGGGDGKLNLNLSSSASSSSTHTNKEETTKTWNWNNFIVPGATIIKPKASQVYSVLNDKPIHYVTIIDPDRNLLFCEHFPTDSCLIMINSDGQPVPDEDFQEEFNKYQSGYLLWQKTLKSGSVLDF